jgi:hypothetical protein
MQDKSCPRPGANMAVVQQGAVQQVRRQVLIKIPAPQHLVVLVRQASVKQGAWWPILSILEQCTGTYGPVKCSMHCDLLLCALLESVQGAGCAYASQHRTAQQACQSLCSGGTDTKARPTCMFETAHQDPARERYIWACRKGPQQERAKEVVS